MAELAGPDGLVLEVEEYHDPWFHLAVELPSHLHRLLDAGELPQLERLGRPRLLTAVPSFRMKGADGEETEEQMPNFVATIVDDDTGTNYQLVGTTERIEAAELIGTESQAFVTPDEQDAASRLIAADERFARDIAAGTLQVVPSMPGAVLGDGRDGRRTRLVTMALHRIGDEHNTFQPIDVDIIEQVIARIGREVATTCGVRDAGNQGNGSGTQLARATVRRGAEVLWEMVVARPSAQPQPLDAGLSIRRVDYKGRRVLYRADTPIVNVKYDPPAFPASYRDWLNSEASFEANGIDAVPGYRLCPTPPTTLFDLDASGNYHAGGNFSGVSFHWEGEWVVLTSVMQAGWYRYRSVWRFHPDGTIAPTFGFSAVDNPATCRPHTHHCYWRFDFDIGTPGGNRVESRSVRLVPRPPWSPADPAIWETFPHLFSFTWTPVGSETRMTRHWLSAYRVSQIATGDAYVVYPGPHDGVADAGFGVGDVWVLQYHPTEDHDPAPGLDNAAHIDQFVNGESTEDTDVVLWYAGHAYHDQHHDELAGEHGHVVGPILRPDHW